MGPKPPQEPTDQDLFRTELVNLIEPRHELVRLAELIDWPSASSGAPSSPPPRAGRRCPRA